ncbi:MAG: phage terminase large subunit [Rickettsiales bacterium]|nr:phage terminase large subunit [Rickettsiales bacterium]
MPNFLFTQQLLAQEIQSLRESFPLFLRYAFASLGGGAIFLDNWHLRVLAEYLAAVEAGHIKRLIINMPPRYLKSLTVSVAWPAWLLGQHPARRIIVASYAEKLSLKHSLDCRHLLGEGWYQRAYPDLQIFAGQNEKHKFVTTRHGFRLATSVGGTLTGEGGDILIIDDPINPLSAESSVIRDKANRWFEHTFSSRLNDKNRGAMVIVMQRLHEADLSGYLRGKGGWEVLDLPAIAPATSLIGDYLRREGEALHEARENLPQLQKVKHEMGSHVFSAQYQQRPRPKEGAMLRRSWLRNDAPPEGGQIVQSWDTAIKAGKQHDFSVCTSWAICTEGYYLLDVFCARLEYPALRKQIIFQSERYQPDAILLEDKASGQSLLQELRRETALPLIAIQPLRDKLTRAASASALFESGRVYLPQYAHWLAGYEQELLRFPATTHDDQVDSTTQFLNWIRQGNLGKSATLRRL